MSTEAIPMITPPWQLVKHELEMFRQINQPPPQPTVNVDGINAYIEAKRLQDLTALGPARVAAIQNAANVLLGRPSPPAWGGGLVPLAYPALTALTNMNGGPAAWGGTKFGLPSQQQLPLQANAVGGLPKSTYFDKAREIVAWWDKSSLKWVAKKGTRFLGFVGEVLQAYDIYQWSKSYWPSSIPLPSRVETQYVIGSGSTILYKHPGGDFWRDYPPPGYDSFGRKIW